MISQYLSNLLFYDKTNVLRVTISSAIKIFRNSFKQKIMADIGNLKEDLVLTKHDGSQNGRLEPGMRLGAIHSARRRSLRSSKE